MASPTLWTWVWASFGSWWCTGKPGVLQSMGLQRVRHDWVTEMNWIELNWEIWCVSMYDSGFWIENRLWKVKGNLGDQWRGCCSGPVIQLMTQLGWWLGDFKWLVSQDIFEILSIHFGDGLNIWYEKKKKKKRRKEASRMILWFLSWNSEIEMGKSVNREGFGCWGRKTLVVGF